MPPSRRRPVPSPPTGRPRVAGLRKRATDAGSPGAAESESVDPFETSGTAAPPATPGTSRLSADLEALGDESATDGADDARPSPSPRPVGRRGRGATAVGEGVLADPDRGETGSEEPSGGAAPGLLLPLALVVAAAVLVGLGVWFQGRAGDVRYNRALVDSAGTTEVSGQVRDAVEKAFSYNFADVSATEKAAGELLAGKAKCQYDAIFGPVRTLAPEQKLVVTVKAVSSGVTSLDGDRATVLLFLDQVTTRTTDNQSGGGIAMMRAGAQKVDGRWKVDNMEMFGQTGEQSAETAKCG